MTKLVFLDTETTGLDPDVHEIWEVAAIVRDGSSEITWIWQLPVDLGSADPMALNIGRFHERRNVTAPSLPAWCRTFSELTWGAHLVGSVVSFDEERLRRVLRKHGSCPGWHYHLVDVEAMAAGHLGIGPPWKSDELSKKVGVEPPSGGERHTALGDALWARRMYDAMTEAAS